MKVCFYKEVMKKFKSITQLEYNSMGKTLRNKCFPDFHRQTSTSIVADAILGQFIFK